MQTLNPIAYTHEKDWKKKSDADKDQVACLFFFLKFVLISPDCFDPLWMLLLSFFFCLCSSHCIPFFWRSQRFSFSFLLSVVLQQLVVYLAQPEKRRREVDRFCYFGKLLIESFSLFCVRGLSSPLFLFSLHHYLFFFFLSIVLDNFFFSLLNAVLFIVVVLVSEQPHPQSNTCRWIPTSV